MVGLRFVSLALGLLSNALTIRAASNQVTVFDDGYDPIKNFCMRIWHQSTIKNQTLYLDGGMEGFAQKPNASKSEDTGIDMGYNYYLFTVDLTQPFNSSNVTQTVLAKNASPTAGDHVPMVERGSLFAGQENDSKIYMYGGTVDGWNTKFPNYTSPTSQQFGLWSYDTQTEVWDRYDTLQGTEYRPGAGANAEAPDLGLGFYFSGEIDGGSSPELSFFQDMRRTLEGLVIVNTTSKSTLNVSTEAITGGTGRTRGSLVYIPEVGDKGILVAIGGGAKAVTIDSRSEADSWIPMEQISIFDVASIYGNNSSGSGSHGWYQQNATGDIPSTRRQFCMVYAPAPDNSSLNIYLYGGSRGSSDNQFFDDVYVLSLPSFVWTRVYGPGSQPRYAGTCHRVGNRQLLSVGGAPSWGFGGACDPSGKGFTVFDMSTLTWGTTYTPNDKPYTVPSMIYSKIGGDGNGGATKREPEKGFTQLGLHQVFDPTYTPPADTPQNSSKGSGISGGAIAGIVIGVLAVIAIAAAIGFFLRKRKQQSQGDQQPLFEAPHQETAKYELQAQSKPAPVMLDAVETAKIPHQYGYGVSEMHAHEKPLPQPQPVVYHELPTERR